jgi:carotenoid cleavage dioxygenase
VLRLGALATAGIGGAGLLAACGGKSAAARPPVTTGARTTGASTSTTVVDHSKPWWLRGDFAPVPRETEAFDLKVEGTLPPELSGLYVRNGSNPKPGFSPHWFLGDGMVHGVRLADGKAQWYRNRYVRGPATAKALGEQPRPGHHHAGMDMSPNTNVIGHAGRTLALVEAGPSPYELTHDLDTVGPCDFDGTLRGGYTAHPLVDPVSGELHAVSYFWGWGNRVRYTVIGTDGRVRRSVDVRVGGSPMMHSFSLTENYVVLYDLPAVFDKRTAAKSLPWFIRPMARASLAAVIGRNPIPEWLATAMARPPRGAARYRDVNLPYRWDDSYPARIGIFRREGDGNDIRWFDVEPCYVFHPLNAYEDGTSIVLDVVRHPKMFDAVTTGPEEGPPTLDRWTVDLVAGKVREERVDDHPQEFPRADDRRAGRRHRYGYSVGFATDEHGDAVLRHDRVSGERQRRTFGAGRAAGEFTFVPTAPDAAEEDGVLIGYVQDAREGSTDLVVLDAQTLEDVAAVHLPVRVPAGFHGNWLPT